jgi:hypothetical protein
LEEKVRRFNGDQEIQELIGHMQAEVTATSTPSSESSDRLMSIGERNVGSATRNWISW